MKLISFPLRYKRFEFHVTGLIQTKHKPEVDSPTHQMNALLRAREGSSHWDVFWKTSKITELVFVFNFWNVKKNQNKTKQITTPKNNSTRKIFPFFSNIYKYKECPGSLKIYKTLGVTLFQKFFRGFFGLFWVLGFFSGNTRKLRFISYKAILKAGLIMCCSSPQRLNSSKSQQAL